MLHIAIYHLSIKIISRGKGKSAVAAAAYRSGEKITNAYDGMIHDYSKKGGVTHTEILLPDYAPKEYFDRSILWNSVEKIEKNKNSQLAREIEIALPAELSSEQNLSLVREYVNQNFVSVGMCADICIHNKNDGNPHAHIMLTMRPIEQDGTWGAKSKKEYMLDENGEKIILKSGEYKSRKIDTTDWNDQTKAEEWRKAWADIVNNFLEENNHVEKIDHRSYERQGIEKIPTIHLGVAASQMEQRGIITERRNTNRKINSMNKELKQLRARISKLQKWADEMENEINAQKSNSNPIQSENLLFVFSDLLSSENKSHRKTIIDLKSAATTFAFLQENNISNLPELHEKINNIRGDFDDVRKKLKSVERRLETLDEHILQSGNYKKYRAVYKKYKEQKPKQQDAFYENHRAELTLCNAAEKYLKAHLNGHKEIPLPNWKAEHKKLTAEKGSLYKEFYHQKENVRKVEVIQKSVYNVFRKINQVQEVRSER